MVSSVYAQVCSPSCLRLLEFYFRLCIYLSPAYKYIPQYDHSQFILRSESRDMPYFPSAVSCLGMTACR